uniref:Uncharacterized protein n=1 Tax=Eptatretus burgeri TaxID=7764 RepID=A0A8C4QV92_EPTBU
MLSLSPEELRKLNLTIDTLEALTNLPLAQQNMTDVVAWSVDQANAILMNYFENVPPPNLTAVDLTALGQFICCMTVEQIAQISAAEYRSVIAKMGQVTCLQQETLVALKNKSEEAIGSLSSWTTSILLQIGNVAAGMNSLELSSMSEDLLKLLPPGAVSLFPENVLKELSPKLLSLLNPESLASMTTAQRDALNPEQLTAVKTALGELPPPPEGFSQLSLSNTITQISSSHWQESHLLM